MSYESLLTRLKVPPVPQEKTIREPWKHPTDKASSLSSPNSLKKRLSLEQTLIKACRDLPITSTDVRAAMTQEDIHGWYKGEINFDTIRVFAKSLAHHGQTDNVRITDSNPDDTAGKHFEPTGFIVDDDEQCGNRTTDHPITYPLSTSCENCINFERIQHPHLGHCKAGQREAISGLWDTDRRSCDYFVQSTKS